MKSKGFTLVELIAVITVLALLLVIAIPGFMKARDNALQGLSKTQQKNLKYAGETVGVDLDDYMSDIYNCVGSWIEPKCNFGTSGKWESVELTVDELKEHNYFEDTDGHCKGSIFIMKRSSGYDVNLNGVTC